MKIELDPNEKLPNGKSLAEAVVDGAAALLAKHVIDQAGEGLSEAIMEARERAITQKVPAMVEEVMQGPLHRTDRYGTVVEETTLRELVVTTALQTLDKPVSKSYSHVSGYSVSRDDNRSLVEYFVARYVRAELENQIKAIATDVVKVTGWGQQLTEDIENSLVGALRDSAKRIEKNGSRR